MFDEHTYPKGGALLFSLRKQIGEEAFYKGLKRYLTLHHNTPVDTRDLSSSMIEATGLDLQPWFDQWIYKPGHPVIDWSWTYDGRNVLVHVRQTQDTSKGIPIYKQATKVAMLTNSSPNHVVRALIYLNAADQVFAVPSAEAPNAVVFDPDQEFVREIKDQPWKREELLAVVRFAPNCVDKLAAMNKMLSDSPSSDEVSGLVDFLRHDRGANPAITDDSKLGDLKRPELRAFFESELGHESVRRRAQAIQALAQLPSNDTENAKLRSLINDKKPYRVVAAAISALAALDYANSEDLIRQQASSATNLSIRENALVVLTKHNAAGAGDLIFAAMDENSPGDVQLAGVRALAVYEEEDPRFIPALRHALKSNDFQIVLGGLQIASSRKLKVLLPDLAELRKRLPLITGQIDEAIAKVNG